MLFRFLLRTRVCPKKFFFVRSFFLSIAPKASVERDKVPPACVFGSFTTHAPDSYFAKLAISTNSRYNRGFQLCGQTDGTIFVETTV